MCSASLRSVPEGDDHPIEVPGEGEGGAPVAGVHLGAGVEPHVEFGSVERLSFAPSDLLSAMWMKFALALVGGKSYRECKSCGKLFELSPETGSRSNRQFCPGSGYCKTKDFRKRKQRALKLWALKTPIREIAAQADTRLETVRRWIKEAKERSK